MVILGIDTSCDETAASVLENGKILSNIVYSQSIHKEYGGVVPNLASKDHEKHIYNTIIKAVESASISLKQIDAQYFILLNSDIEVTENWISPIISLMD